MIRPILAHAIIFLSVLAATSLASAGPSPSVITAPEVKQLMESGDALLVHVLSGLEYQFQHIPGSINIPINKVHDSKQLPADKNRPLVFYCMGRR